jgi:hypothetical protein
MFYDRSQHGWICDDWHQDAFTTVVEAKRKYFDASAAETVGELNIYVVLKYPSIPDVLE